MEASATPSPWEVFPLSTIYLILRKGIIQRTAFKWSPVSKFNLISLVFAKNCERSEILPDLQANKMLCNSFLDAGRRHENIGSETKVFIIHSNNSSRTIGIFLHWSSSPNSHGITWRGPGNICIYSGLHYQRGTLQLGNLNLLYWI